MSTNRINISMARGRKAAGLRQWMPFLTFERVQLIFFLARRQ
jgi:hypothetical protein